MQSKSGEAEYFWDYDNRLTSAVMTDGTTVSHAYDVDGNRVQTSVAASGGAPSMCSGSSASYLRTDTLTQGNWKGTYGADGQYINGNRRRRRRMRR